MENKTHKEPENPKPPVRIDHKVILDMVTPHSRVLDLGCGDGTLLSLLIEHKKCTGSGIEISEEAIYKCVAKGLSVSHGDIDSSLSDYSSKRFDFVILCESVQQVLNPKTVILESLRIGKKVIVGIPNFCHWKARLQIFFQGRVPVTAELPYEWYDTPNLRFLSLKDFRYFCKNNAITIVTEKGLGKGHVESLRPNLLANNGLFLLEKNDTH